ncbi:hypothetical protein AVEN_240441-1, partial [Araneus ventricosus]
MHRVAIRPDLKPTFGLVSGILKLSGFTPVNAAIEESGCN